jgi:hypothetical protein
VASQTLLAVREQVEQMALGGENVSVTRTHGGANVLCLAGFLRDDDLIGQ